MPLSLIEPICRCFKLQLLGWLQVPSQNNEQSPLDKDSYDISDIRHRQYADCNLSYRYPLGWKACVPVFESQIVANAAEDIRRKQQKMVAQGLAVPWKWVLQGQNLLEATSYVLEPGLSEADRLCWSGSSVTFYDRLPRLDQRNHQ